MVCWFCLSLVLLLLFCVSFVFVWFDFAVFLWMVALVGLVVCCDCGLVVFDLRVR